MAVLISHRSTLAGRRPVKIDGVVVGECRMVSRMHGSGTQLLFFLPGGSVYFATFENDRDLRAKLPGVLADATPGAKK
jgi:hypothetical protein